MSQLQSSMLKCEQQGNMTLITEEFLNAKIRNKKPGAA